jgi:filamentous hemagglutinin
MKNTSKLLMQAFLWLIIFNPMLIAWQSMQFAILHESANHKQQKSSFQAQPFSYIPQMPRHQQELYQQMILTHAQHQAYIHEKAQEPRCMLNLKNKEQQISLGQMWHQELMRAQLHQDQEQTFRLSRRLQALAHTITSNHHDLNSELESCLLSEFKESYTTAKQLEQQFPDSIHIKIVGPLIYNCAEVATGQADIGQAFTYSDLAHNVLTIFKKGAVFIGKAGTAVSKGIIQGAVQSAHNLYQLTKPSHWMGLAQQLKHLATLAAQECVKAEELGELMFPTTDKNYDEKFKSYMALHRKESAAMHAKMKNTWNKLKETAWEQLAENGVALGASLILDYVTLNAVGAAASATTNKVIEEIAMVFKRSETIQETYLVEVAGVGKMQLEGEALSNTNKLKNIAQKETELIAKTNQKQPRQAKESNVQFDFDDDDFVHPSTAVGRKGESNVKKFLEKRKPTEIYGRKYSGHAIERMQERGFTPTVIEHIIKTGIKFIKNEPGKLGFYDPINEIQVLINDTNGRVISAIPKKFNELRNKGII